MEYCGFLELALLGKIFPSGIRHTRHATGGSSNGFDKAFSRPLSKSWLKTCMNVVT
jgi:hypothetical protein